jgi:hypothetical protein
MMVTTPPAGIFKLVPVVTYLTTIFSVALNVSIDSRAGIFQPLTATCIPIPFGGGRLKEPLNKSSNSPW